MATKENSSGLLSKVAKFVRNPTTNWADLDSPPSEADSGFSKQTLKAMIERKRQNDFVRKREFDQLRKLRNRDPSAVVEVLGRPSFYQSSLPSNIDERAHTLKKIDEIEAQMSKQWWKGKQIEGAQEASNFPVSGGGSAAKDDGAFEVTQPSALMQGGIAEPGGFARTHLASQLESADALKLRAAPPTTPPSVFDNQGQGFSTSKLFAVELSDDATDPELEEAAIRYANGDNDGAESGLLEALTSSEGRGQYAETWVAALFDFYRATGQQAKFDGFALDFAARVGRSAPAWHSLRDAPAQKGDQRASESSEAAPQGEASLVLWQSPQRLDSAAVDQLHLALASAPLPWRLSWQQIAEIQPDALRALARLFSDWCDQRVKLHFEGVANLEIALKGVTISGNKSVDTLWWRLRMDALRVMRMQDEFELVALDYCVTYEVSPPSWQDALCEYTRDSTADVRAGNGVASARAELEKGSTPQDGLVPVGPEEVSGVVVELVGEILGDAADALRRLEAGRHQGEGRLVVSCARLIRVDFSAAGSILNWVSSRQAEGFTVQFREVHRLVGAFFNVIGINEHAKVVLRAN